MFFVVFLAISLKTLLIACSCGVSLSIYSEEPYIFQDTVVMVTAVDRELKVTLHFLLAVAHQFKKPLLS